MHLRDVFCGGARRGSVAIVLSVCSTILLAGCGGGSGVETVPVRGTVKYNGQPVREGTVTFVPTASAAGNPIQPAVGTIQPDGSYQLMTVAGGEGAIPGEYVVTVRSTGDVSIENPHAALVWNTPEKYADPEQSGLTATVPPDHSGVLEVNFELED